MSLGDLNSWPNVWITQQILKTIAPGDFQLNNMGIGFENLNMLASSLKILITPRLIHDLKNLNHEYDNMMRTCSCIHRSGNQIQTSN